MLIGKLRETVTDIKRDQFAAVLESPVTKESSLCDEGFLLELLLNIHVDLIASIGLHKIIELKGRSSLALNWEEGKASDTGALEKREGNVKWICVFVGELRYFRSIKVTHVFILLSVKRKWQKFWFYCLIIGSCFMEDVNLFRNHIFI